MAEKLSYLTPTERLEQTFREECEKARRWSDKFFVNRKAFKEKENEMIRQCETTKTEIAYPDAIEYVSPAGNHWLVNRLYTPGYNKDPNVIAYKSLCMMFGLTEKYFWIITSYFEGNGYDWTIVVFTPHFIQRFYERVGLECTDRMKLLRNLQELLYNFTLQKLDSKTEKGQECYGRIPGCMCYGHKDKNGVIVFRTLIPDNQLMYGKLNQSRGFRKTAEFINSPAYDYALNACFLNDKPCKFFRDFARQKGMDKVAISNQLHYIGLKLMVRRLLLEYSKQDKDVVWRDNLEQRETIMNNLKDLLLGTPLTHHFSEYEKPMRDIMFTFVETLNEFALEKAMKAMRDIYGDHYVTYDLYHISLQSKNFKTIIL